MTVHQFPHADDAAVVHHLPAADGLPHGEVPPAPASTDERSTGVNSTDHGEGGTPAPLSSLAMMRLGILSALEQIEAAEEANDYGALAVGALAAKSLRGDLSLIEREAKQACRRVLDELDAERRTEVPLPGHSLTLERASDTKRTQWRHIDLALDVLSRVRFDPETGEERPVLDVVAELLAAFSLTPRLSQIRALGIDPSDYCVEAREASVKITGDLS